MISVERDPQGKYVASWYDDNYPQWEARSAVHDHREQAVFDLIETIGEAWVRDSNRNLL